MRQLLSAALARADTAESRLAMALSGALPELPPPLPAPSLPRVEWKASLHTDGASFDECTSGAPLPPRVAHAYQPVIGVSGQLLSIFA
ncbi:MAG: hypothetical protein SGJ11_03575 [Phycisphaerae bacterium]|nr:hypothetical protein [Phycisphaerae bacterium]